MPEQNNLSSLKQDHKNARKRTDRSAALIKESLTKYGAARSIVIDEDNRILAGNGTVEGAIAAGLTKLRVIETDGDEVIAVKRSGLTEEQKVGLAIADNRTGDLSEWDKEMLVYLADEHDINPWFSQEDLNELFKEDTTLLPKDGKTDPDDCPDLPASPTTEPGDLYILGDHRLLCGSATSTDHLAALLDNQKADLWITDPPYNVAYEGKTKDALKIQNDSMKDSDFRQFLSDAYSAAHTVLREGASFYIWHADSEGYNFRGAARDTSWDVRQCLIWAKQTMVMGRQDYQWQHEPCLYGWTPGAAHYWAADRKQTTLLQFDRPSRSSVHPTMKPVALFQYQMANSSKPGDIVLDSFGGSGTTLIAAERLRRKARLTELDPSYCDVIVQRWEEYTGQSAIRMQGAV